MDNLDPNQIHQLITLLQQMLPQEASGKKSKKKAVKKPKSILKSNKIANPARENKFDSMPEKDMHKSDTIIDQKLKKFPPTPRRPPAVFIDVVCRICGKKEKVSPKLVSESVERYKCNRCSSSQG